MVARLLTAPAPPSALPDPAARRRNWARDLHAAPGLLQILAGVDDPLNQAARFPGRSREGLHVRNPLALLARDLGPIVGVAGIGQVFVLLELIANRAEEVVDLDTLVARLDVALEGKLLGPPYDGLDHGAGGEVLEEENLLVAVDVGHLEEAVLLVEAIHLFQRGGNHPVDDGLPLATTLPELGVVNR